MRFTTSVLLSHSGYCIAYSPTGRCFAVGCESGLVVVVDSATHTVLHTLKGHSDDVLSCAFSIDGTLLATASADKTVKLWQVETGSKVRTLTGHSNDVNGVVFTSDGKHIISAGDDKTARVWDVASGTLVKRLTTPGVGCSVALSALGTLLAIGFSEGMVALFDVTRDYTPLSTFRAHVGMVPYWLQVSFSPVAGSTKVVTCSSMEKNVKVWDLSGQQPGRDVSFIGSLRGHTEGVQDVRFSGDGALIASSSLDNTVKVWDAVTGRELRTLTGHSSSVSGVSFHPTNSGVLVSSSNDFTARVWSE